MTRNDLEDLFMEDVIPHATEDRIKLGDTNIQQPSLRSQTQLDEIPISPVEVQKAIDSLSNTAAPGPDGVSPLLYKRVAPGWWCG